MGRTAKFNRNEAIDTCMHEFWRHGYEACSVKAISEKLGITRSSFYNAFGSRESLFLEALDRYFTQTPDQVLNELDESTDIPRLLTAFFRSLCHNRSEDPEGRGCLAINCVAELVGANQTLGPVLENTIQAGVKRMEKLLRLAVDRGQIEDTGDLPEKAMALQNLLIGLSVMSKVERNEERLFSSARQTLIGLGLYAE